MGRVEAMIFAAPEPVGREAVARVVERDCNIDLIIDDIRDGLRGWPYELVAVAGGMVGDDAEGDVAGALRAGIGAALLVRTGKYRQRDETRFDPAPTAVVDDLTAATDWILETR